jgi:uncharacterized membrane protein
VSADLDVIEPVDADTEVTPADPPPPKRYERFVVWVAGSHPAARLTAIGIVIFAALFGALGVQNHRNFGTWSYDMGIYDQAFWLVSRGESFMSVRGMFFWGHHVNLIVVAFVPFYWLGAGPEFLYVVQACVLALGAAPLYLITRDVLGRERWGQWMGFVIAVVYLMYAPVQWISWAMFHPEALLITPFLFAWWFGLRQRWHWYWAMVLLTLSMREDVALAIVMLGPVLAIMTRSAPEQRRVRVMCAVTSVVGVVWYLVATRIVLVVFNDGQQPFYVTSFYGNYGSSMPEIVWNMVRRPDTVVSDAVQHDRLTFYKQMMWPLGWMPLANPLPLLMALPQLLASVIGLSPYARMIRYQYTSVMIAPVMIALVYGVRTVWRFPLARLLVPVWLLGCAYVTNVAWSPSPLGTPANYAVWSTPNPRHDSLRQALAVIPDDASVTATYQLLPHLTHRREAYDWPNPFKPAVWGNDDCGRLPDPRTVDYVALDRSQIGDNNMALFEAMIVADGPFDIVFEDDNVVVLRRVGTSKAVDVDPQRAGCDELAGRRAGG